MKTGKVIFSGIYSVCTLPSGTSCVKAVFPLPKGNATVMMSPTVGQNGELILDSTGKKFADPGFYFLLSDSKGKTWSKYINSFRDRLIVQLKKMVFQLHTQRLWSLRVLKFKYHLSQKNTNKNL
jgi:hypothetical protein